MDAVEKIEILKRCFEDTIWMAIRYAHGRQTYAPSMVRDAVAKFKTVFPEWKLKNDVNINYPECDEILSVVGLRGDFLDDLFRDVRK